MFHPILITLIALSGSPDKSTPLGNTYVEAITKINTEHARKPGKDNETELAGRIPKKATKALAKLLKLDGADNLNETLERCAAAALELDRVADFRALRDRLSTLDAVRAESLGVAHSTERVLLLGEGGLSLAYLQDFEPIIEDILEAYDDVFGFEEFSKIPGKKLRIRLHLEEAITKPPHFAPQFPFHSEIDFPVIDAETFRSPTAKGQFLFYGLCHELGHVIAMWGDRNSQEDHHAWAHYTGLVIMEHLSEAKRKSKWISRCRDSQWKSIEKERKRLEGIAPGTADRDEVLALLFELQEAAGTQAIGAAFNQMDSKDKRLRVNHVRYYSFRELESALLSGGASKKQKKAIKKLFSGAR